MPGGSGLLQQAMERWEEVIAEAKLVASECSSACSRSCPDCLQNFRNAYYHAHLDRKLAEERLVEFGLVVTKTHDIAAKAGPVQDEGVPVNAAEALLKLLIFKAGLPTGIWHKRIEIGLPYRFTEPDVYWDDPEDANDPGLAVYLDGLSQQLHGNPSTRDRDLAIRQTLRSKGYDVVEIPASHLQSKDSMVLHVAKIAKFLFGRERAKELRSDTSWFESSKDAEFEVASAGVKVGTFDPDLYPAPWQLLLANIASVPGIRVEPGAEVACDGRVLGSFVAELSGPSGEFCLLDAGDEYVVRCEEAIRSDGKQALKVDPSDPESFSSIMKAVGGS